MCREHSYNFSLKNYSYFITNNFTRNISNVCVELFVKSSHTTFYKQFYTNMFNKGF